MLTRLRLLLALCLFAARVGAAPQRFIDTAWRIEDGLSQSTVASIAQTPDGYLWVATQEGIARFDGLRFESFAARSGASCKVVTALFVDEEGALWAGAHGCGPLRFDGTRFVDVDPPKSPHAVVRGFAPAPDGGLYAVTHLGVVRIGRDRSVTLVYRESARRLSSIAVVGRAIYVGHGDGALRIEGDAAGPVAGLPAVPVSTLAARRDGTLFAGTREGLYRVVGARAEKVELAGLPVERISALRAAADDTLWVSSESGGVCRVPAGRVDRCEPAGLPQLDATPIESFFHDRESNLWIGTSIDGLHQIRPRLFDVIGAPEGLASDVTWSLLEARDGAIWIGTDRGGLHRWDGKALRRLVPDDGVRMGSVFGLAGDGVHELWAATSAGLAHFVDEKSVPVDLGEPLLRGTVRSVLVDRRGDVWVGTETGIVRRAAGGERFQRVNLVGSRSDAISALADDGAGGLWAATDAGAVHVDAQLRGRVYTTADGLADNLANAILVDGDTVWLGTSGGLSRLRGGRIQSITTAVGLYDDTVLALVDDGRGAIWITSNRGPYRIEKQEIEDFFAGRRDGVTSFAFGRSDGLRGIECNSYSQSAALRARDGRVWVPTIQGAASIDPARITRNQLPPSVVIEEVIVDGRVLPPGSELEVPPGGVRDLQVRYTGLSLSEPAKVRFQSRLVGLDGRWSAESPRRTAYFTNLPPGRYQFEVLARNGDGVWSPRPAALVLSSAPRLAQRRAFWALCALLVLAILGLTVLARLRGLRAHERELEARVAARTADLARAKREIERALAASAESKASLDTLVEELPAAITLVEEGRVSYANRAALELLGADEPSELVGLRPGELFAAIAVRPVIGDRPVATPEMTVRRLDGDERVAEVSTISLLLGGTPTQLTLARDVTERKQLETRLAESDRLASLGTLAAGMAHEINNPLAYVLANLEFLMTEVKGLGSDEQSALAEARSGAERVRDIVKALKLFTRGEEEGSAAIDLAPVLASSVKMTQQEVRLRAELRMEVAPGVPPVVGSAARFGQVMVNLIINAAQAIPPGNVEGNRIGVRLFPDERGFAVLEVSDSGCGIPPEHLRRVFDPFFTTKPVGVGTGLGLAICHGIAVAAGGSLTVESQVGRGTTFRLALPPGTARTGGPLSLPPPRASRRGRLLVVDDEPMVARALARAIGDEHDVTIVASGAEALRAFEASPFDLVLSDLTMPDFDGRQLYEELRRRAPSIIDRFVFVTGGVFTTEMSQFLASIPVPCLAKPFERRAVRAVVAERMASAAEDDAASGV